MGLAAIRTDVAVLDALFRDLGERPVDLDDPNWMDERRRARPPAEEAGVAAETAAVLGALLDAYETGGAAARAEVREILRAHPSFRAAALLPREWDSVADFRRRLLHVSAIDQGVDPRDELIAIWSLCHRARERGIDVEPVLREVADLSSGTDHYGFGSMRDLIMRGLEPRDVG